MVLVLVVFLIALGTPQRAGYKQIVDLVLHNWIAMAICAVALWIARRDVLGSLPPILRGVSGILLPTFVILTILGLLIWPQFWILLQPFGVIEKEVRPGAITATITLGLIGCALLMLRAFFRWIWRFSRRYEHSGLAVGFGPVYFFFRRRRTY